MSSPVGGGGPKSALTTALRKGEAPPPRPVSALALELGRQKFQKPVADEHDEQSGLPVATVRGYFESSSQGSSTGSSPGAGGLLQDPKTVFNSAPTKGFIARALSALSFFSRSGNDLNSLPCIQALARKPQPPGLRRSQTCGTLSTPPVPIPPAQPPSPNGRNHPIAAPLGPQSGQYCPPVPPSTVQDVTPLTGRDAPSFNRWREKGAQTNHPNPPSLSPMTKYVNAMAALKAARAAAREAAREKKAAAEQAARAARQTELDATAIPGTSNAPITSPT